MFQPIIDLARIQPLLDTLEQARRDIEALDVPPALERALQRVTEARGAHMSTRIEGNPMTEEEVRAEFARTTPGTGRAELETATTATPHASLDKSRVTLPPTSMVA